MLGLSVLLGFLALSSTLAERKRYDGYQVWKVHPRGHHQVIQLQYWEEHGLIDVWEGISEQGAEILVSPSKVQRMRNALKINHIPFEVISEDYQRALDKEWARLDARYAKDRLAYDKDDYNTYEAMLEELDRLAEECPENLQCRTYSIGQSVEGRELVVFEIVQDSSEPRPALWFDSLIHAREWLAGSTHMRIIDKFITDYDTDEDVQHILDTYDVYFLPVHNPDGYVYSWETDRNWRKSRNINEGSSCVGTDLNRNFDAMWGNTGASGDPCSNTFYGPGAASEPETQAVQTTVEAMANRMVAFNTIHTAATAWLTPYGFHTDGQCTIPDDNEDIQRVTDAAVEAIEATHGTTWRKGNSCQVLYVTSGTSQDWGKINGGAKYSFTPELRGPGFDPGLSAIEPSFAEMWNGFVNMVNEIEAIGI